MIKEEFCKIVRKYVKGTSSEKEKGIFNHFMDKMNERAPEQLWTNGADREKVRQRLMNNIHKTIKAQKQKSESRFSLREKISIAVSVAVVVTGVFFLVMSTDTSEPSMVVEQRTITTEPGEKCTVHLSDKSVVKLNSASSLTYSNFKGLKKREVTLTGEAYFEVTHNPERPFVVHAGQLSTTVLGTSFNINNYKNTGITRVTVASGKVKVAAGGKQSCILHPGEQAGYEDISGALLVSEVNASHFTDWKEGIIHLERMTLKEAAPILERWYGIQIKFGSQAVEECVISGKYQTDDLMNILEGIRYITNVKYKIEENRTVLLYGKSEEFK